LSGGSSKEPREKRKRIEAGLVQAGTIQKGSAAATAIMSAPGFDGQPEKTVTEHLVDIDQRYRPDGWEARLKGPRTIESLTEPWDGTKVWAVIDKGEIECWTGCQTQSEK